MNGRHASYRAPWDNMPIRPEEYHDSPVKGGKAGCCNSACRYDLYIPKHKLQ